MKVSLSKQRLSKGLCPRCGNEAAPFYYCDDCRYKNKIENMLRKGKKFGVFNFIRDEKDKRKNLYFLGPNQDTNFNYIEAKEGDSRLKPRLSNIPIDVEKELILIFESEDNREGLTIDEIHMAWGKLRLRTGRTSAASDMANIIRSNRKREEKLLRRVRN